MARALESVEGVKSVNVNYPEKKAVVLVENNVAMSELCQALMKGGFVGRPC